MPSVDLGPLLKTKRATKRLDPKLVASYLIIDHFLEDRNVEGIQSVVESTGPLVRHDLFSSTLFRLHATLLCIVLECEEKRDALNRLTSAQIKTICESLKYFDVPEMQDFIKEFLIQVFASCIDFSGTTQVRFNMSALGKSYTKVFGGSKEYKETAKYVKDFILALKSAGRKEQSQHLKKFLREKHSLEHFCEEFLVYLSSCISKLPVPILTELSSELSSGRVTVDDVEHFIHGKDEAHAYQEEEEEEERTTPPLHIVYDNEQGYTPPSRKRSRNGSRYPDSSRLQRKKRRRRSVSHGNTPSRRLTRSPLFKQSNSSQDANGFEGADSSDDDGAITSPASRKPKELGLATANFTRYRKLFWDELEVESLLLGVEKYGIGKWKAILADEDFYFQPKRTNMDLKDKWRNITKDAKNQIVM